ncbi:MAG: type III pantothenate kinase [Verrucomicrobiia bacterium]|jgi:type III pantothenate kinase
MMILIDIGNTHTHIGFSNEKRILRCLDIPTDLFSQRDKSNRLFEKTIKPVARTVHGAVIASVSPKTTPVLKSLIKKYYSINPVILNHSNAPLTGFNYPKPETLGADRIANAVAAFHIYGAPAIVVDFGTAITVDILNSKGFFEGGVILPGINLMTSYLYEKTALLPQIQFSRFLKPYGKNTKEAILAGINYGVAGMISHIVQCIIKELNLKKPTVIATGGYGEIMAKRIPLFTEIDKNLTLKGLLITYKNLKNKGNW